MYPRKLIIMKQVDAEIHSRCSRNSVETTYSLLTLEAALGKRLSSYIGEFKVFVPTGYYFGYVTHEPSAASFSIF